MDTKWGALLLAVGLAAGCTSLSDGSSDSNRAGSIDDAAAASAPLATRNIEHSKRDGLLAVQFEMVNRGRATLHFKWTIDWMNRAGNKLEYGTELWTSERLAGGESKSIRVFAPLPEADGWALRTDLGNDKR